MRMPRMRGHSRGNARERAVRWMLILLGVVGCAATVWIPAVARPSGAVLSGEFRVRWESFDNLMGLDDEGDDPR